MKRRPEQPPLLAVAIINALDALAEPNRRALWRVQCELGSCWQCQHPFGTHAPNCEVRAWSA
jgi:hypothetical protein